MNRTSIIMAITLSNLVGCLDDELADEQLSSAEQEVDSTQLTGLLTCNNGSQQVRTCDFFLRKDDGQGACFLAGIKGRLQGNQATFSSTVRIESVGGNLVLRITPGVGVNQSLSASAVCVTTHKAISFAQWNTGQPAASLGNVPGMQCFLTNVETSTGFTHSSNHVSVFQLTTGEWVLGGSQSGSVRAFARCIVPTGGSVWGYGYAWNNGTTTLPLAQNSGGVACALNTIQGAFTTATDRVSIGYQSSVLQWNMTLSGASHAGGARCFD